MDRPLEHYPTTIANLPMEMTEENKAEISELLDFEDITQEQADEFLGLLWDIACCATLIHFDLNPIQSIMGKRQALATEIQENTV